MSHVKYRIKDPFLIDFFNVERSSDLTLESVPGSLFDRKWIQSKYPHSKYPNQTFNPGRSIYLHIPKEAHPHVISSYEVTRDRHIARITSFVYDYMHIKYVTKTLDIPDFYLNFGTMPVSQRYECIANMFRADIPRIPNLKRSDFNILINGFVVHFSESAHLTIGDNFNRVRAMIFNYLKNKDENWELHVSARNPVRLNRYPRHYVFYEETPNLYAMIRYQGEYYIRLSRKRINDTLFPISRFSTFKYPKSLPFRED